MIFWDSIYKTPVWMSEAIETRFRGVRDRYGKLEWNEKDRAYRQHVFDYVAEHPLHFLRNYYCLQLYNVFV